ncbi:MAG: KEOPS complex subunit Cgi121 [Candidatus Njordarchaeales archaeon]
MIAIKNLTMKFFYFRIISLDLFLKSIDKLPRKEFLLQPIPCWILLDQRILDIPFYLSIRDFYYGVNKAKKFNLQFLIRLAGTTQISEAIKRLKIEDKSNIILIFFYNRDLPIDFTGIINKIKGLQRIPKETCKYDINKIIQKYNITTKEIELGKRFDEDIRNILLKIIIERMSIGYIY